MNTAILKAAGIDYDNGIRRFMDDREIYEDALNIFAEQINLNGVNDAFKSKDYPRMFDEIHSLKGAVGSLEMTYLYSSVCTLTELLRNAPYSENDIALELRRTTIEFDRLVRAINSAK